MLFVSQQRVQPKPVDQFTAHLGDYARGVIFVLQQTLETVRCKAVLCCETITETLYLTLNTEDYW